MMLSTKPSTVSNYCSSCTPGDPTDIICEDAEGANTVTGTGFDTSVCGDAVWATVVTDGNNTITEENSSGTSGCPNNDGAKEIKFYTEENGAGEENTYMQHTITPTGDLYIQAYLTALDLSNFNGTEDGSVISMWEDGAAKYVAVLSLVRTSNNIEYQMIFRDNTDTVYTINIDNASGNSNCLGTNPTAGDRIVLEFHKNTAAGVTFTLNGTTECDSTDYTMFNDDVDSYKTGSDGNITTMAHGGGDAWSVNLDMIAVDNDTMPGACSE
jgi:hypothetical protein